MRISPLAKIEKVTVISVIRHMHIASMFLATTTLSWSIGLWGCTLRPQPEMATDACAKRGGVMVNHQCVISGENAPGDWSDQQIKEIQRGFEERAPGGGRLY